MTVLTRVAAPGDAAQLARISVDTWRTAYRDILPTDFLDGLSYESREQRWRGQLAQARPQGLDLVAEDDAAGIAGGCVVGFACSGPERDGIPGYDGEIYAIYVLAEHQHRGIGQQLMAASARHLAAQGFRAVMLWTLEGNLRARAFYEALGGQIIRHKPVVIGETSLIEVAYGWPSLDALLVEERPAEASSPGSGVAVSSAGGVS